MNQIHRTRAAALSWLALLAVTGLRPLEQPVTGTVYPTFAHAGAEFAAGRKLYDEPAPPPVDNFRYSPLVAAAFAPFSLLPLGIGGVVWRLLGATLYLTGLVAWARRVGAGSMSDVLLWVIPLSLGSLYNGQANPHILGMMLWAGVLAARGRWTAAAVLVAGAAMVKGYPLTLGMLFALVAPLRFGVPLAAAVLAGLLLPYAFQSSEYVTAQYRFWAENLSHDDRTTMALSQGYQDFHMLLRLVGMHIPRGPYLAVQAVAGTAAAGVMAWQLRAGIDRGRVVLNALALGLCWMTLFGPSTESSTFILMAPLLAQELTDWTRRPLWAWAAAIAGELLFLASVIVFAFPHHVHRPVIASGIQPLAALLLSAAAVRRVLATPRDPAAVTPPAAYNLGDRTPAGPRPSVPNGSPGIPPATEAPTP